MSNNSNLDINYRIKYYMGNIYNNKIVINTAEHKFNNNLKFNKISVCTLNELLKFKKNNEKNNNKILITGYINPFADYIDLLDKDKKFLYSPGDEGISRLKGFVKKAKPIGYNNIVIVLLNKERHWGDVINVNKFDIPFDKKNNIAVWRGTTTGSEDRIGSRFTLVKNYYNKHEEIDVAFNSICQEKDEYKIYVKPSKSIAEQLKCKFIISVEGNDVASGLKWQLYSNSVVMMTKPTICSWFMEDHLIPFVHYIPLKPDYSDLYEQYKWALNNLDKCKEINKNAKQYVEQFLDYKKQKDINKKIMKIYFENVKII